jgi:hypothetical protein
LIQSRDGPDLSVRSADRMSASAFASACRKRSCDVRAASQRILIFRTFAIPLSASVMQDDGVLRRRLLYRSPYVQPAPAMATVHPPPWRVKLNGLPKPERRGSLCFCFPYASQARRIELHKGSLFTILQRSEIQQTTAVVTVGLPAQNRGRWNCVNGTSQKGRRGRGGRSSVNVSR